MLHRHITRAHSVPRLVRGALLALSASLLWSPHALATQSFDPTSPDEVFTGDDDGPDSAAPSSSPRQRRLNQSS